MFDVTNKLSFDSLDYWLQEFTSNGGKQAIMAVVANKVRIIHFIFLYIIVKKHIDNINYFSLSGRICIQLLHS